MDAEILSVGTEVTRGDVVDTNAAYLARELSALGANVRFHVAVADCSGDIEAALRQACQRSRLVLVTGGLGPTPDDLTREVVARVLGVPLITIADEVERLRNFFRRRGRPMPESNLKQAMVPAGARALPNSVGTACGFWATAGMTQIIVLPGVPTEMEVMFSTAVRDDLRRHLGEIGVAVEQVQTFGLPESELASRIHDLMRRGANPDVGTRLADGTISVRIVARAATRAAAQALAHATAAEVAQRLGEAVYGYGETTLEEALARHLERLGCTIAIAESCTGGLVGGLLTSVPGISRFFLEGVVAYSNEAKVKQLGVDATLITRHGVVSAEVAQAMAAAIRRAAGADIGVGVTGIAGPGGATPAKPVGLVYIAIADNRGGECHELRLAGSRQQVRLRAARAVLNFVRLRLLRQEAKN